MSGRLRHHTVADIGLLGTKAKVDGKAVDAVDVFIGGSSGPHATQGVKILESVPCDSLPQVLEGLVRYVEADKVRKQLRTPAPARRPSVASRPGLLLDDLADGAGTSLVVDGVDGACPLHGYRFNIKTGACSTDPALRARPYRLVARDGRLTVDV